MIVANLRSFSPVQALENRLQVVGQLVGKLSSQCIWKKIQPTLLKLHATCTVRRQMRKQIQWRATTSLSQCLQPRGHQSRNGVAHCGKMRRRAVTCSSTMLCAGFALDLLSICVVVLLSFCCPLLLSCFVQLLMCPSMCCGFVVLFLSSCSLLIVLWFGFGLWFCLLEFVILLKFVDLCLI